VVREIESVLRPSINFEIQLGFSPRIGLRRQFVHRQCDDDETPAQRGGAPYCQGRINHFSVYPYEINYLHDCLIFSQMLGNSSGTAIRLNRLTTP